MGVINLNYKIYNITIFCKKMINESYIFILKNETGLTLSEFARVPELVLKITYLYNETLGACYRV